MLNRNRTLILCLIGFGSVVLFLFISEDHQRIDGANRVLGKNSTEGHIYQQPMNTETILYEEKKPVPSMREVLPDENKLQNDEKEIGLLIEEYHNNLTNPAVRQALEQKINQLKPQYKEQVLAKVKKALASGSESQ